MRINFALWCIIKFKIYNFVVFDARRPLLLPHPSCHASPNNFESSNFIIHHLQPPRIAHSVNLRWHCMIYSYTHRRRRRRSRISSQQHLTLYFYLLSLETISVHRWGSECHGRTETKQQHTETIWTRSRSSWEYYTRTRDLHRGLMAGNRLRHNSWVWVELS